MVNMAWTSFSFSRGLNYPVSLLASIFAFQCLIFIPHLPCFSVFNISTCCEIFNSYVLLSIKVKCTLVQALILCTGLTAHRGSRGIALLFHDHGPRRGWGVSVTPRPLFSPGKDPVQEAGLAPGPV